MAGSMGPLDLFPLIEPKSVAIVGASDKPGSLGGKPLKFLKKFGYPGLVWPVNPSRDTVDGMPCFRSVAELPSIPDLVLIAVSATATIGVLRDCIAAGIRHGIAFAGGFAEAGPEGAGMQEELIALCRASGFALCGPNTVGIINTHMPLTASFAASLTDLDHLVPGDITMISQSGGMAVAAHALAQRAGFGFRNIISVGNEAVLSIADFIRLAAADPKTRIISMYLEGTRHGTDFASALATARAAGKPVVVLKVGRSNASARAAAAHTGSLAGEDSVWRAVLDANNAILVESLNELVDVSLLLSSIETAAFQHADRIAVVSLAGEKPGVLAQLADRFGLKAAALSEQTRRTLMELAPDAEIIGNTVRLTADRTNFVGAAPVVAALAGDAAVGAVFVSDAYDPRHWQETPETSLARLETALPVLNGKPICAVSTAIRQNAEAAPVAGHYLFADPVRACTALARVAGRDFSPRPVAPAVSASDFNWLRAVPGAVDGLVISEHECHAILASAGLPVAAGRLVTTIEAAEAAAETIGYPLVMKGITPAITHRAAAGLVALRLADKAAASAAYERLQARAATLGVTLDGIYVQRMEAGDNEILVSALRDPVFGVVVTCGVGGVLTEAISDVALRPAPFDDAAAAEMLSSLALVQRNGPALPPLAPLAEFVAEFSRLAAAVPWPEFVIEINPVKWRADAVVAVDGLIIVEQC
ncbi:MAG TPA: acetate--CoA ligase family protein [Devosiaceae bacterium]